MELAECEDLAGSLQRGSIPVDESLEIDHSITLETGWAERLSD